MRLPGESRGRLRLRDPHPRRLPLPGELPLHAGHVQRAGPEAGVPHHAPAAGYLRGLPARLAEVPQDYAQLPGVYVQPALLSAEPVFSGELHAHLRQF